MNQITPAQKQKAYELQQVCNIRDIQPCIALFQFYPRSKVSEWAVRISGADDPDRELSDILTGGTYGLHDD